MKCSYCGNLILDFQEVAHVHCVRQLLEGKAKGEDSCNCLNPEHWQPITDMQVGQIVLYKHPVYGGNGGRYPVKKCSVCGKTYADTIFEQEG